MTAEPARPQLHLLVNPDTGEVQNHDELESLRYEHDELAKKYLGVLGENGRLKKQIAELRGVEPEAETIRDVLDYWRERCKPNAQFPPDGPRWGKVRARLREKLDGRDPLTPAELKLAVDGALTDRWHTEPGMAHRIDAEYLFRSYESVEKLRDMALGFQGHTGTNLRDLWAVADELHVVNWRHLLRQCECGHRRVAHSRGDPAREGQEPCFECECQDFYEDPFAKFNQRDDKRGKEAA